MEKAEAQYVYIWNKFSVYLAFPDPLKWVIHYSI
jgi:hypothetical protein